MKRRQLVAAALAAALGAVTAAAVACGEDRGEVTVEDGTGTSGTTGETATATVDTSATDPEALDAAMADVARYGRGQTVALVGSTRELEAAVRAGSVARARRAYAAARPAYERIEPLVALFPGLDRRIDAREDDFPRKAADPGWTGFHPIERALWKRRRIDSRTQALASGLVRDSERLDERLRAREVPPEVAIPGVAELVDEVEESKITGEEERYSKLDLPTFLANLEGAEAFYKPLEDLLGRKDPALEERIDHAFDDAFDELEKLRRGDRFLAYDELTDTQQRSLKQRIEALAEPLARVQGTLGVRS
jgi:iron uptake system component EfeO